MSLAAEAPRHKIIVVTPAQAGVQPSLPFLPPSAIRHPFSQLP